MTILEEVINIDEMPIIKYLKEKGIIVDSKYFSTRSRIDSKEMLGHMDTIIDIQKSLCISNKEALSGIESKIGKRLEEYRVQLKKASKAYEILALKSNRNKIDRFIFLNGQKMIKKGEEALGSIDDYTYFEIIRRSMNKNELCLGRVDLGNLKKHDGILYVGSIKGICYNLFEEDIYKYIKKLEKKNVDFDIDDIITDYAYKSHLSYSSIKYLKALCMYPRSSLRLWERYRNGKSKRTNEYYEKEFDRARKYEN